MTVVSDAVNVASRLEGLTKERAAPSIVSGTVVAALERPGDYSLAKIGPLPIGGRTAPIDAWAVLPPVD